MRWEHIVFLDVVGRGSQFRVAGDLCLLESDALFKSVSVLVTRVSELDGDSWLELRQFVDAWRQVRASLCLCSNGMDSSWVLSFWTFVGPRPALPVLSPIETPRSIICHGVSGSQ